MILEGAVLAAANHPDVAGPQAVAEFGQHAQLPISPVDAVIGDDVSAPATADEIEWRLRRQRATSGGVQITQDPDGSHERLRRRRGYKVEDGQEGRRPTSDRSVLSVHLIQEVKIVGRCQLGRLGDRRREPVPGDYLLDRREGIGSALLGGDQGGTDPGIEPDLFGDGAALPVKGGGMAALGAAEQVADDSIEDVEGEISQGLAKVKRYGS